MQNKQISVIIVSFNVRPFLVNALESIKRALNTISHEIIVIDNASADGSVQMLKERYPDVHLIDNKKNIGFAAANNQGLILAEGKYPVLINPDTLVQEDTFSSLLHFMETHPRAGAVTCKILNADGSFSVDSRHSIPSPMTAFWKQIGFSRLFPRSRRFARYNMTFLDENETQRIDAISGSFMFIRSKAAKEVGLLDEDYFMYCEDVDYCYRIGRADWEIYYIPVSCLIHYKGESTRKNDYRYALNFNRSLYLFYNKHFHIKYFPFFKGLILSGVFLRGLWIYIKNSMHAFLGFLVKKLLAGKKIRSKRRVLLVCTSGEAAGLSEKIRRCGINLCGLVFPSLPDTKALPAGYEIVMTLDDLTDGKVLKKFDEIIFSAEKISYKKIISTIANPALRQKECRIIPPHSDLIIGKSSVSYMQ